jgi:hypothetical protein
MWPLALWNTTSLFLTWYQSPEFRVPVIAAASSPRHPPVPVLAVALFPVSQPPPRSPRLLVVALFPAAIASIRSARPPPARPIAPRSGPPAGIRSARPHPPGSLLVLVSWRQLHRPPRPDRSSSGQLEAAASAAWTSAVRPARSRSSSRSRETRQEKSARSSSIGSPRARLARLRRWIAPSAPSQTCSPPPGYPASDLAARISCCPVDLLVRIFCSSSSSAPDRDRPPHLVLGCFGELTTNSG